jgi:tetratricopeptide (TPR) repeat protein
MNRSQRLTAGLAKAGFLAGILLTILGLCLFAQENLGRGRITGQVMDEAGQPVAAARIIVQSMQASSRIEGKSDKKGHFAVAGMGTGAWRVSAVKEGYLESSVEMQISQIKPNPAITLTLKKAGGGAVLQADKSSLEVVDRGNAFLEEGKYDEAIAAFEEFLVKYPDLYQVHLNIGGACLKKGDLDRAEAEFKAVLDKILQTLGELPKDKGAAVQALLALGEVGVRRGDFEAAGKSFREALALSPEDEAAAYNVGEILFSNQKTDEAIGYFEMAIRIKKDWPKPYYRLGFVHLNKGDYAKSPEYFKAFIELDPGNPEVPNVKNIMATIEKMKKEGRP